MTLNMNDFQKSMFIFFNEWGGSPEFQAEHDELYFHGIDIDELLGNGRSLWLSRPTLDMMGNLVHINRLYDLGWQLAEDGEGFVSYRWGSCWW